MPTPILHVDMDAFYASIEQRDRPELRGLPVIVGGTPEGRGVVCAASYEARKFGVHSAMPASTARRLCPQGVFLPTRIGYYAQVGRQLRTIFQAFTPLVEPLSLDEAFLDVHGCESLFGPPEAIARQLKERIRAETQLTASVGVAANKFLAKLASDLKKPDGLVVIPPEQVRAILDPLPVGKLWGVGAKGEKRLHAVGIRTIADLAQTSEKLLVDRFGESGRHLWLLAQGQDDRVVIPDDDAKSISTETTFARDIGDREALRTILLELTEELGERVRRAGVRARTVEIKVRTSDFQTFLRSKTLAEATDLTEEVWRTASALFEERVPDDWLPLRLLGVGVTGLGRPGAVQASLFDQEWRQKHRAVDAVADEIRKKFGDEAIGRAAGRLRKRE